MSVRLDEDGEVICYCCLDDGSHNHAACEHPCCPDWDDEA